MHKRKELPRGSIKIPHQSGAVFFKSKTTYNMEEGDWTKNFNWSGDIDLNVIGSVDFVVKDEEQKQRIMKASIFQESATIFVVIEETVSTEIPYIVKNLSPELSVTFYQCARKNIINFYEADEKNKDGVPFAWDRPHQPHEIKLTIKHHNRAGQNITFKVNMDKINQRIEQSFDSPNKSKGGLNEVKVILKNELENNSRVLKIFSNDYKEIKTVDEESVNLQICMKISSLGVSLISPAFQRRKELLFACINDLEVLWIQSQKDNIYQIRAKNLHIDYNSYYNSNYPVFFMPVGLKELREGGNFFFDLLIQKRNTNKEVKKKNR